MIEVGLGVLLAGAATFALIVLPPFHPAQLWLIPWGVASGLLALGLLPYSPMRPNTAGLIIAATGAFCAGALTLAPDPGGRSGSRMPRAGIRLAAGASVLLLTAMLGAFLLQVSVQFGPRAAFVSSGEVRQAIQAGTLAVTIKYIYVTFVAATLCGLAAGCTHPGRERKTWLLLTALSVVTAYFSTGRGSIVIAALCGTFTFLLAREQFVSRRALGAGLVSAGGIVFLIFSIGGAIIGKTFAANPVSQVRSVFTDHGPLQPLALPYQYATAPLVALEVQLESNSNRPMAKGCATLAVACQVGAKAGLALKAEPAIEPFTAEPLRWNTYTAIARPLIDGGPALVPVVFYVLGLICGSLYRLARRRDPIGMASYSVIATAIVYASTQMNFFAPYILGAVAGSCALLVATRRLGALEQAVLQFGRGLARPESPGTQRLFIRRFGELRRSRSSGT